MIDREVLIGITGGIAAYKTAALVSQLVQGGAKVSVAMTEAACQFVGVATLAALTGRPVATKVFDPDLFPLGPHIELAQRAELFCIAPATADFLAKAAHGHADDLVTTLYLCFAGPGADCTGDESGYVGEAGRATQCATTVRGRRHDHHARRWLAQLPRAGRGAWPNRIGFNCRSKPRLPVDVKLRRATAPQRQSRRHGPYPDHLRSHTPVH